MTDLSPAAKAVLKLNDPMDKEWQEFLSHCSSAQGMAENEGLEFPYSLRRKAQELKARLCAAALRKAADQVVPYEPPYPSANSPEAERFGTPEDWMYEGIERDARQKARRKLRVIAAELDNA